MGDVVSYASVPHGTMVHVLSLGLAIIAMFAQFVTSHLTRPGVVCPDQVLLQHGQLLGRLSRNHS